MIPDRPARPFAKFAVALGRYGVAGTLLLFVPLKWTEFEVHAVEPLVMNSPFTSWVGRSLGMVATTRLIGTVEAVFAILMFLRRWSPRVCFVGSVGAAATFAVTLSMAFTTPGGWAEGRPTPLGWFLLKDVLFFAGAVASAVEAARAASARDR